MARKEVTTLKNVISPRLLTAVRTRRRQTPIGFARDGTDGQGPAAAPRDAGESGSRGTAPSPSAASSAGKCSDASRGRQRQPCTRTSACSLPPSARAGSPRKGTVRGPRRRRVRALRPGACADHDLSITCLGAGAPPGLAAVPRPQGRQAAHRGGLVAHPVPTAARQPATRSCGRRDASGALSTEVCPGAGALSSAEPRPVTRETGGAGWPAPWWRWRSAGGRAELQEAAPAWASAGRPRRGVLAPPRPRREGRIQRGTRGAQGARRVSSKKPAEFRVSESGQAHPDQTDRAGPSASSEPSCVHADGQSSSEQFGGPASDLCAPPPLSPARVAPRPLRTVSVSAAEAEGERLAPASPLSAGKPTGPSLGGEWAPWAGKGRQRRGGGLAQSSRPSSEPAREVGAG